MAPLIAFFRLIPGWLWLSLALLIGVGLAARYERGVGDAAGAARVQLAWDKQKEIDRNALELRLHDNLRAMEKQIADNRRNERAHQNEITDIKRAADELAGQRLRLPATVCASPAGTGQATSASAGDEPAAGTVALPDDITKNLRALMLEADTVTANCRALQRFVRDNGFYQE